MFFIGAGFNTKVVDLEDFDPRTLLEENARAIFLMATYGEGEPTDNAVSFIKWLKNADGDLEDTTLHKLDFAVFGLGNRQYEHYNAMGKLVNKRCLDLGGKSMFDYGEGDDDATLEEDFESWKSALVPALCAKFLSGGGSGVAANDASARHTMQLQFRAVPVSAKDSEVRMNHAAGSVSSKVQSSTKHFFTAPRAPVLVNRELRTVGNKDPKAVGSTRHIEIDLQAVGLSYYTADNLAILPENSPQSVAAVAGALGYNLDELFKIEPVAGEEAEYKAAFPTPCSVREALTLYLDIQGPVKLSMLKHLLLYTTDAQQVAWLQSLLDKSNRTALKALHDDEAKSLVDLLTGELSSCKIPLSDFLHIVPFIQPRYYTISSSSSCFPGTVHITVSITEYDLKNGKQFTGLTSSFVRNLGVSGRSAKAVPSASCKFAIGDGTNCRVFVRESSFRLPASLSTPIIMIGPGTGLAPMRALLQERKFQQQRQSNGHIVEMGDNILYFGCRQRDVDYIYKDEMEQYEKEGVLTSLLTAFSRESKQKVYVQHLMKEESNATQLLDLVQQKGAYVYVCGATAMGADVMTAVVQLLQSKGGMSNTAATDYIKDLQQQGRYVQELWTA